MIRACKHKVAVLFILAAPILGTTLCVTAQQAITAPRADGHTTPMLLYKAVGATGSCAPLAIISHGAGGSENGYRYLAEAMSQNGYTTIVMAIQMANVSG